MASHGVASDRLVLVAREISLDQCRELLGHIAVHVVVLLPKIRGGIHIEASAYQLERKYGTA
jgi:hypothetical protein